MALNEKVNFKKAVPVWQKGTDTEMNINLLFRAELDGNAPAVLRITGHAKYTVRVNGKFVCVGPARAGHGYYRVDELDITKYLTEGKNIVGVSVSGYNCNSYYLLDEPSFLCAEIERDGGVVAYTGRDFTARLFTERERAVQRYSFQRPFTEVYDFDADYNRYFTDPAYKKDEVELERTEDKNFIARGIYYPEYDRAEAKNIVAGGTVGKSEKGGYWGDRSVVNIGPALKGYRPENIPFLSTTEALKLDLSVTDTDVRSAEKAELAANTFVTYELERNLTGLVKAKVKCLEDTTLFILFDELRRGTDVPYLRLQCANVIAFKLKGGCTYDILTEEPYTMKYMNFVTFGGAIELENVGMIRIEFAMSEIKVKFASDDEKLKFVYDAALETFRQNVFDIYMDCPSRERAGWLCDSFFTSRVEYALTGKSDVERNFLSNFLMPESFKCLPEGMLPMCYPADHYDGCFIPNWAMWYVIELEEYEKRTSDRELVDAAKDRVYALLKYFKGFENEDGLLQNLPGWIFVEWSKSNDLVQNENYPTNMLYCKMKHVVAKLYGDDSLDAEADKMRDVIRKKSKGEIFYCDNSVFGEDGKLHLSGLCTESCQYYAFFTGVATIEDDRELWDILVRDFGPARKSDNKWPDIFFANAFIGNYLRLELLANAGYKDELLDNILGYFTYMAEKTGTLWENDSDYASCNHGFASHIIYWLKMFGYVK